MAQQTQKFTGQFRAQSDDGTEFVILEYTTFLSASEGEEVLPGRIQLRTGNGQNVNRIGEGIYQVGHNPGIIVRRI